MSQLTALHPSDVTGNGASHNSPGKGTMSGAGGRALSAGGKNKTGAIQSDRTMTHGDSVTHFVGEDSTSGAKSQNLARRQVSKGLNSATSNKKPSTLSANSALRLENQYAVKKKRYAALRKEVTDKQRAVQELYNDMSQLREKVIASGAKDPGKVDGLKFEVGSIKQSPSPAAEPTTHGNKLQETESQAEKFGVISGFVGTFDSRLEEISKTSHALCQDAVEKLTAFLNFITSCLTALRENNGEVNVVSPELLMQLEVHGKDSESLKTRLGELKRVQKESVAEIVKNVHTLYDEYENYRSRCKEFNGAQSQRGNEMQLNTVVEELQAEREKVVQGKERMRHTEVQLQKARAKMRELETQVVNDEGKIQQLQSSVKALEAQSKQKDQAMEVRIRDMQKTMKNSETLVARVEKQRDSFESRLVELKEKMCSKENEAMHSIKELSEKLEIITAEINEEREKRQRAEDALDESEERYKNLEEKSQQLCELAEKNKDFTVTDGNHTENEIRLFNELQATRAELEGHKEKILQLEQEKEEIIAVMHQAASRDDEDDSRDKLAAELVFKSNELQNLMVEYSELKKVAKIAQERSGTLEKQLIEIQARLHAQSREGGKATINAHTVEMQQQISDLRNNLAEVLRQKEELENTLTQKQLELEQRDRVMREQSKFLKVRDELLGLLRERNQQGNEQTSNSEENDDIDLVNKQIAAKTEAIQELYATLESKQLQVMRLEKMVKLMEDQQDRAQAQRTRLENRIAQLELTLQRSKEHRSKGFGIL